ncbi:MAG: Ig-like domain-containing protein [bacterium]
MKRFLFLISLASMILISAGINYTDNPSQYPALKVTSHQPSSRTVNSKPVDEISLTFSQPVIGLTEVEDLPVKYISDPPVKGHFRAKGRNTVVFFPENELDYDREYQFTIVKGLMSADSSALQEDYTFTIKPVGLKVIRTNLKYSQFHIDSSILLIMNYKTELNKIKENLSIRNNLTGQSIDYKVSELKDHHMLTAARYQYSNAYGIIIKPVKPLSVETHYSLKLYIEDLMISPYDYLFKTFNRFVFEQNEIHISELPFDRDASFILKFSNPILIKNLNKTIRLFEEDKQIEMSLIYYYAGDNTSAKQISAYAPLEPNSRYRIEILKSLKDIHLNNINNPGNYRVYTGDYMPILNLDKSYWYSDDVDITINYLNRDYCDLFIRFMDIPQTIKFLNNPPDYNELSPPHFTKKRIDLPGEKNKFNNHSININKTFAEKKWLGAGFIREYYKNSSNMKSNHPFLFQQSSIEMFAVFSSKNGFIQLNDKETGNAVSMAKLLLYSNSGRVLNRLQLKDGMNFIDSGEMNIFDSSSGRFIAGLTANTNVLMPVYHEKPRIPLTSDIFTERNLYTLKDTVIITGIVRERSGNNVMVPKLNEVQYTLRDSKYNEVLKGKVNLNANGVFSFRVFIPDTFITGYYYCQFNNGNDYLSNISFRVEEFKSPEFEVNVSSRKPFYETGESIRIDISGNYLSGFPMAGDSAEIIATGHRTSFSSSLVPGFNFRIVNDTVSLPDTMIYKRSVLSEESEHTFVDKFNLKGVHNPIAVSITGTVKSSDKKSVSNGTGFAYYPREKFAGIKFTKCSDSDSALLQWTAVTTDTVFLRNQRADITILRSDNYNFYDPDTVFNERRTNTGDIDSVKIFYEPNSYYKAELNYDRTEVTAELYPYYYASMHSPLFITDKQSYSIGDTARIKIIPPVSDGNISVFYGTDSIFKTDNIDIDSDTVLYEIPVTDNMITGFYLCAFITGNDSLQDRTMKNIYISVDNSMKDLKPEISTDRENYEPGDSVRLTITTEDRGEVQAIVSVVDKSVLMLTNYSLHNPLQRFHNSYSNTFQMFSSYNLMSNYYSPYYRNGGAGYEMSADAAAPRQKSMATQEEMEAEPSSRKTPVPSQPQPQIRKDFRKTVYFNAAVNVKNGRREVVFKLPDNTTEYEISVILVSKDKFGYTSKNIKASKKLMINDALPMFLRPGDRVAIACLVLDNTKLSGPVETGIEEISLDIESKKKSIKPVNNKAFFSIDADIPYSDSLKVMFSARKSVYSDYVEKTIPIIDKHVFEHNALFSFTRDSVTERIILGDDIIKDISIVDITLSSSRITGMTLPLKYLNDYEYLCLEQRLSRILPLITGEEIFNEYNMGPVRGRQLRNAVKTVLKDIPKYQSSNGGFMYYEDSRFVSEYLSLYTMYVMKLALDNGYSLQQDVIDRGIEYIERIAVSELSGIWNYSNYARWSIRNNAVYILALYGNTEYRNQLNDIFKNRDKLYLSSKAKLLETLDIYGDRTSRDTLVDEIRSLITHETEYAFYDDGLSDRWLFQNDVKNSAAVLKSLLSVYGEYEKAPLIVNFFRKRIKQGFWVNTHTTALVLEALTEFYRIFEKDPPRFNASAVLNDETVMQAQFRGREDYKRESIISGRDMKQGKNILELIKKGQGILYYTIDYKYARKEYPGPLYNGFEVKRTIRTMQGKEVTKLRRGEIYEITVDISTNKSRSFVTIDDPLPAGVTIIKKGFATEKANLTGDNRRSYYWGGFAHEEFYRDRAVASAIYLGTGKHSYRYYVKAVASGSFKHPPLMVFEMYTPSVFGRTGGSRLEIEQ